MTGDSLVVADISRGLMASRSATTLPARTQGETGELPWLTVDSIGVLRGAAFKEAAIGSGHGKMKGSMLMSGRLRSKSPEEMSIKLVWRKRVAETWPSTRPCALP